MKKDILRNELKKAYLRLLSAIRRQKLIWKLTGLFRDLNLLLN